MRSARLLSSVIPLLLVACTTTKSTELGKPTASSEKSVDLLGDLRAGPNAPEANNLFYDISLWSDRHNPVAAENAPAPALFRAVVAETSVRRLPPSHDAARLSCPLKRRDSFR